MVLQEVRTSNQSKRRNLKSKDRLPLQDKTNVLKIDYRDNVMSRKAKTSEITSDELQMSLSKNKQDTNENFPGSKRTRERRRHQQKLLECCEISESANHRSNSRTTRNKQVNDEFQMHLSNNTQDPQENSFVNKRPRGKPRQKSLEVSTSLTNNKQLKKGVGKLTAEKQNSQNLLKSNKSDEKVSNIEKCTTRESRSRTRRNNKNQQGLRANTDVSGKQTKSVGKSKEKVSDKEKTLAKSDEMKFTKTRSRNRCDKVDKNVDTNKEKLPEQNLKHCIDVKKGNSTKPNVPAEKSRSRTRRQVKAIEDKSDKENGLQEQIVQAHNKATQNAGFNSQLFESQRKAVLRDIAYRSSFVSLERNIEKSILEASISTTFSGTEKGAPTKSGAIQSNKKGILKKGAKTTVLSNTKNTEKPIKRQAKIFEFVEPTTTRLLRRKNNVKNPNTEERIPIYKQIRNSPESFVEDVYNFDEFSDSDIPKGKKGKKHSVGYEKYMDEAVKKLEKKFKKTTRRQPKTSKNIKKKENIKKVGKLACGTSKGTTNIARQIPSVVEDMLGTIHEDAVTALKNTYAQQITNHPIYANTIPSSRTPQTRSNQNIISTTSSQVIHSPPSNTRSKIHIISMQNVTTSITPQITSKQNFTSTTLPQTISYNPLQSNISPKDNHDTTSKENISSNVASPDESIDFDEPIANSTVLNITKNLASPWRANLNVTRNPHFLHFKQSFLPNYNQEMVLDSTIVEKIQPNRVEKITRSPKQTTILNYIDGKEMEIPTVNSTLFDVDQFSPIKQKTKENPLQEESITVNDKENSIENKQRKRVDKAKRNILGLVVDNRQNLAEDSSPEIVENPSPGISNCFGFDDSISPIKERTDKPARLDSFVKVICKKNLVFDNLEGDVDRNKKTIDECAATKEIGLFEDYHPERSLEYSAIRQYVVKKKRQRRRSPSPYSDSDNEDHHHRKKRNKRTKKEEEEAEKWAAAFNSMCEEVEKFPLEIE